MNREEVIRELVWSGLVDWVPLHDVVWFCTEGSINPVTKRAVLDFLGVLYVDDLMVPGDLGASGFEDWPAPSEEWVLRSERELDRLEWKPMGDGFWLRLGPKGEQIARQAQADGYQGAE